MSSPKSGRISDEEINQPSEYGGDSKEPSGLKGSVMRDIYRSDPTDPSSGPS